MNRITVACGIALIITTLSGCIDPDPPHYETPLPNGLRHFSNGGEQGWIGTPFVNSISTPVYPVEDEWHCNEFAVIGDDVIGIEIQYAVRAFVDPPVARRWFYLDTKVRTAATFESFDALREHCESLGHATMPKFVGRTSKTRRRAGT
jgi:hypothetical protein